VLTSKAKYALRAMIDLAEHGREKPVFIADIAARQDIPRRFLENILIELRRDHLVISHRGKNGGYAIARDPKDISFAEVIRCINGPLAMAPCASLNAYRRCDDCVDEATCAIRKTLIEVRENTADILERTKLG
jgi:Rrf2 family protein